VIFSGLDLQVALPPLSRSVGFFSIAGYILSIRRASKIESPCRMANSTTSYWRAPASIWRIC